MVCLIVVLVVENAEDGEEKVDDVKVEADGSSDLLLDMVMTHDQLGVNEDVATEDKSSDTTVNTISRAIGGQERSHEYEKNESPKCAEEIGHP